MKYIGQLIVLALILTACSGKKTQESIDVSSETNLTILKKERDRLLGKQHEISDNIKAIDSRLTALTPQKLPLITTFIANAEPFNHFLEVQGNVETKQNIVLTPEIGGILEYLYVKEGQKVAKGQLLAKINDGGLSQQLAQLKIQANLAKITFEKQERLWNQKIGSEIQYLQAKTNFESQQKAIEQLKKQISKTMIKAPFSGIIDDIITEKGNMVAPAQTPLLRIVNLKDMYITTEIPERYITDITKGKMVEVFFPVLNQTFKTSIRKTGNYINPANRTFNVEIAIPNKNRLIKPNLTAKLKINDYTNPNAILIPQSIISENAKGEQYIYTIENKNNNTATAKLQIIETGKTQGDKSIEVLKGINFNSEIIKEGARSIENGQKVQLINN